MLPELIEPPQRGEFRKEDDELVVDADGRPGVRGDAHGN
jgi:hypothetical protein